MSWTTVFSWSVYQKRLDQLSFRKSVGSSFWIVTFIRGVTSTENLSNTNERAFLRQLLLQKRYIKVVWQGPKYTSVVIVIEKRYFGRVMHGSAKVQSPRIFESRKKFRVKYCGGMLLNLRTSFITLVCRNL